VKLEFEDTCCCHPYSWILWCNKCGTLCAIFSTVTSVFVIIRWTKNFSLFQWQQPQSPTLLSPHAASKICTIVWQSVTLYAWLWFFVDCISKQSATGIVMPPVCLSVCNAVHCGSLGQCTGLKVVPSCSQWASSYLSIHTLLLWDVSFSHKMHQKTKWLMP